MIIFKVNALLSKDQQLKSLYYFITKGIKELYNRYEELCEAKDRKLNSTKEAIHVSKLANTTNLYDGCKKNHPDRVEILKEKIIRDVITPGQDTDKKAILKNRFPVFCVDQDSFQFRYMRYWIITGHERTQTQIAPELIAALDNIDEYLSNPENVLDYRLDRGDIMLVNNHFICHNRTAYEDTQDGGKQRTMIRAWINK